MKYRKFSNLGWEVSEVGLGCWQIGWCWGDVSDLDAKLLLKKSLDKGVNFFDTSDTYGDGRSEKFLSELKKKTKEKIYITTKLGRRVRGTLYKKGYKHNPMEEFVDRSLINLNTDYEGGELLFYYPHNQKPYSKVNLNTGDLIMFPSNFMYPHSIEPIVSGTRYSIVCWFS